MSTFDIINLLKKAFLIFSICTMAIILPISIYYFKKYKKFNVIKSNINIKKKLVQAVLFSYVLVIIYCTLIYKGTSNSIMGINILPFYTYKHAWNNFSAWYWYLIIFNILLFIPFGFIAPLVSKNFKKFWVILITGMVFSLCIELIQLKFNVGVFDIDDIFNNTLGTLIGYFTIKTIIAFKQKRRYAFLFTIPIILTVGAFICIFIIYYIQPYGNLPCNYICKSETKLSSNINYDSKNDKSVYKIKEYTEEEAEKLARKFFSLYGCEDTDAEIEDYSEQIWYIARGENTLYLKINKYDLTYNYNTFDDSYSGNYKKNEVIDILAEHGITIPEEFSFNVEDKNVYIFEGNIIKDNTLNCGTLKCQINKSGELVYLDNGIIKAEKVKLKIDIISLDKALKKVYESKSALDFEEEVKSFEILEYTIEYKLDTKGYMQPVYVFNLLINEKENYNILIPAIK